MRTSFLSHPLRILCGCLLAMTLTACDLPERPPIVRAEVEKENLPVEREPVDIVEPPKDLFPGAWETWEVYQIGGRGVGYRHIVADEQLDTTMLAAGNSQIQYVLDDEILFRRGRLRFLQSLHQKTTESSKGELRTMDVDLRVGPIQTTFIGGVTSDELKIEVVRGTTRNTRTIAWDPTTRGLLARYQSLRRNPMEKGETRNLRYPFALGL